MLLTDAQHTGGWPWLEACLGSLGVRSHKLVTYGTWGGLPLDGGQSWWSAARLALHGLVISNMLSPHLRMWGLPAWALGPPGNSLSMSQSALGMVSFLCL